ncbi:hypothetical protein J6590_005210 [Homalodisca vitripennis]|nr:hypothetical protein J6590_005210 [Homalodisca vitripennis]
MIVQGSGCAVCGVAVSVFDDVQPPSRNVIVSGPLYAYLTVNGSCLCKQPACPAVDVSSSRVLELFRLISRLPATARHRSDSEESKTFGKLSPKTSVACIGKSINNVGRLVALGSDAEYLCPARVAPCLLLDRIRQPRATFGGNSADHGGVLHACDRSVQAEWWPVDNHVRNPCPPSSCSVAIASTNDVTDGNDEVIFKHLERIPPSWQPHPAG